MRNAQPPLPGMLSTVRRNRAARAAAALRRAVADPAAAGERRVMQVLLGRPRRSERLAMWDRLPGLVFHAGRRAYTHALLPGWEYDADEMRTELIEDLERLAATGELPKVATRREAKNA